MVVRWAGWSGSITETSPRLVGARWPRLRWGPGFVVVSNEFAEESLDLALVPDESAVEELVADGADPSFGECVVLGSSGWDGDDRPIKNSQMTTVRISRVDVANCFLTSTRGRRGSNRAPSKSCLDHSTIREA